MYNIIRKFQLPSPSFFSRFASGGRYNKKKRQIRLHREREEREAAAQAVQSKLVEDEDELVADLYDIKIGGSFDLGLLTGNIYLDEIQAITNCFDDDEVFSDVKRTFISGEISSVEVNKELLFVRYFYGKHVIYPLVNMINMSMIAVKVGEIFIFLDKGDKIDEIVDYLERVGGLDRSNLLWYDCSKKNPLNFECLTYSLQELRLDVEYLSLITKRNIEDYRHCICFQRAFGCFVVPAVLSDWKVEIAVLLDADAGGVLLDSYALPKDVAGQWFGWESSSEFICSEGEKKDKGKMDVGVSAAKSSITILRRNSIPIKEVTLDSEGPRDQQKRPLYDQSPNRRFYSTGVSSVGSRGFSAFPGSIGSSVSFVSSPAASGPAVLGIGSLGKSGSPGPVVCSGSLGNSAAPGPARGVLSTTAAPGPVRGGLSTAGPSPVGLPSRSFWNILVSASKIIKYIRK